MQVDEFGTPQAFDLNALLEFQRNKERYSFLRWGQTGFRNLAIVPPDTGIVHQVNLEYLARVVFVHESNGKRTAYPDTLVGTDSHTTMVNGLGVLGWGVGGIEAEAAMLGQPVSMLIPLVVGVKLTGRLREGATATDLVLTITEMLRKHGVVGKFVEYFGPGLQDLPLADRATIANMSPEYGATCGIFPVDKETLALSCGSLDAVKSRLRWSKPTAASKGLFHDDKTPEAEYSELLTLDLATVEPSLAGPKRPQDRVVLVAGRRVVQQGAAVADQAEACQDCGNDDHCCATATANAGSRKAAIRPPIGVEDPKFMSMFPPRERFSEARQRRDRRDHFLHQHFESFGDDCRRTCSPRKPSRRDSPFLPWVKTSLAPGSKVVRDYLGEGRPDCRISRN